MMLRVQLERQHEAAFPAGEYFRFYGLRLEHLKLAKPDVIVMHPGPINRGREISSEVADSQRSVDFESGGKRNCGADGGARKGVLSEPALVIKNGRVIDPASGHDAIADVWIEDGVIRGVGANCRSGGESLRRDRPDRRAGLHRHARASARAGIRARGDHRDRVARGGGGRLHVHLPHAEHARRSTTTRPSPATSSTRRGGTRSSMCCPSAPSPRAARARSWLPSAR